MPRLLECISWAFTMSHGFSCSVFSLLTQQARPRRASSRSQSLSFTVCATECLTRCTICVWIVADPRVRASCGQHHWTSVLQIVSSSQVCFGYRYNALLLCSDGSDGSCIWVSSRTRDTLIGTDSFHSSLCVMENRKRDRMYGQPESHTTLDEAMQVEDLTDFEVERSFRYVY
jgi:hypothetical protein